MDIMPCWGIFWSVVIGILKLFFGTTVKSSEQQTQGKKKKEYEPKNNNTFICISTKNYVMPNSGIIFKDLFSKI